MTGIYKITFPNGKVYIGQCVDFCDKVKYYSDFKRKLHLFGSKLRECFYNFESNYKIELLEECDMSLLNIRERHYQDFYDAIKNGLNGIRTPAIPYIDWHTARRNAKEQRDLELMAKLESASLTKCSEEALKSNV